MKWHGQEEAKHGVKREQGIVQRAKHSTESLGTLAPHNGKAGLDAWQGQPADRRRACPPSPCLPTACLPTAGVPALRLPAPGTLAQRLCLHHRRISA